MHARLSQILDFVGQMSVLLPSHSSHSLTALSASPASSVGAVSCAIDNSQHTNTRVDETSTLLTTPQLRVHSSSNYQLTMGAALGHVAVSKNDDAIAVVDGAQPVRDENARTRFLFEYAVDVLQ